MNFDLPGRRAYTTSDAIRAVAVTVTHASLHRQHSAVQYAATAADEYH